MINGLANLSNRIALLCILSLSLFACGGGSSSGEGFIPSDEPDPIPLSLDTTALPNAIQGVQYTAVVEASGGEEPYTWTIVDDGGTGMTINNEGIISGTAPQGGNYGLTIQVKSASTNEAVKTSLILTVTGDTPQALRIATVSLPNAEELRDYLAVLEAVGGQGAYQWTLLSSGGSGLQLRDDGLLSGTAPAEGQYGITVSVMDNTSSVTSTLILTVTADSTALTITSTTLASGTVGVRYADVLKAAGGDNNVPYTWKLVSSGGSNLTLSSAGVLSGTPSLGGTFGLVFEVSDGTRTDEKALTLSIAALPPVVTPPVEAPTITTTSLPDASNVLYAAAVAATGGKQPYSWTGGDTTSPGTGFVIDSVSGTITGNTTGLVPGPYGYSVTVTDAAGLTDTQGYVITVPGADPTPVKITTANPLPDAVVGVIYSTVLQAAGGSTANQWSIVSTVGFTGAPPAFVDTVNGILVWDSGDVIAGDYLISIQVQDTNAPNTSDVVVFNLKAVP